MHPKQILVRHVGEKLNKLNSDLEDSQRLEMVRFQESSENDKKTFQCSRQTERGEGKLYFED